MPPWIASSPFRRLAAERRARPAFRKLRDVDAAGSRGDRTPVRSGRRDGDRSVHGRFDPAGPGRDANVISAAGKAAAFERARPLLEALSSELRFAGAAGDAAKVKALVNMVMNINTAGLAEGLGLGEALGLDLTMLREVFAGTGAASRVLQTDGEDMQFRQHDVYFSAAHAAKDSHIAVALARGAALDLPLAKATARQYDRLVERGHGELDKSAVAELTFPSRGAR